MNESRMRVVYLEVNGAEAITQSLAAVRQILDQRAAGPTDNGQLATDNSRSLPAPAATALPSPSALQPAASATPAPAADAPTPASTERATKCRRQNAECGMKKRNPVEAAVKPLLQRHTRSPLTPGSGWSDERRAKFRATMARKRGVDLGEARPKHANGQSTPVNPHVIGAAARIRHQEQPTPAEVAA